MSVEHQCEPLAGEQFLAALRAAFAERCRADAQWSTLIHEAGRAVAGSRVRAAVLDEFSADEVAAALGWSRSMAGRALALADDLERRLPQAHAAMAAGRLELAKARVISEWTRELDDDHARAVCAAVLPEAPRQNQAELIECIGTQAVALDSEWGRRRQDAAAASGDVFGRANPSGTADVCGRDLDPDAAWTGMARIEALALELRGMLRARGVRRPVGWLRVQVLQRLMGGQAAGLDDETMVAALCDDIHAAAGDDPDPDDPGPDDPGPDDSGPSGPNDSGPDDPGPDAPGRSGPNDSGPDDPGPDAPGRSGPDDSGPGSGGPGSDGPDDAGPDTAVRACSPHSATPDLRAPVSDAAGSGTLFDLPQPGAASACAAASAPDGGDGVCIDDEAVFAEAADAAKGIRRGMMAIRMRLSTALGLDEYPCELAGRATLLARTARAMIHRRHAGEWRLVLTDPDGHLEYLILLTRRPEPDP